MRKFIYSILKKNTFVLVMLIVLCPILGLSYATFVMQTNEYRASEMYIGKLLYGMKINGEAKSSIEVDPGTTEVIVEITSLNNVDTKYKLVYTQNENITVKYADSGDASSGLITNTANILLQIENTSNETITVNFKVFGGYKTNDVEDINILEIYKQIVDSYTKDIGDYETLAMFVGETLVQELDTTKHYNLISYTCSNGEEVKYNTSNRDLTIKNYNKNTKCTLYFEELLDQSLLANILRTNTPYSDKVRSEFVDSDTGISFMNISSDTNGKGLYYTEDRTEDIDGDGNGERVYYYRGAVENNYLVFANYCWRIVRTNEDGSIKLRFGGSPTLTTVDGKTVYTCPQTGTAVNIASAILFVGTGDAPKYIGYTYGSVTNGYGTPLYGSSTSRAKLNIDNWYRDYILTQDRSETDKNVTGLIANTIYCNDRSYPTAGYNSYTYYGASNRLIDIKYTSSSYIPKAEVYPQYKCRNLTMDGYTLAGSSIGNGYLTYPAALLTADEVAYAGGAFGKANRSYYLYTNQIYWLMSPFYTSPPKVLITNASGAVSSDTVNTGSHALVPVISLTSNAVVKQGTGLVNDPFVISTD